jgi:hypothetical protein
VVAAFAGSDSGASAAGAERAQPRAGSGDPQSARAAFMELQRAITGPEGGDASREPFTGQLPTGGRSSAISSVQLSPESDHSISAREGRSVQSGSSLVDTTLWALTDSNRQPARCKQETAERCAQRHSRRSLASGKPTISRCRLAAVRPCRRSRLDWRGGHGSSAAILVGWAIRGVGRSANSGPGCDHLIWPHLGPQ